MIKELLWTCLVVLTILVDINSAQMNNTCENYRNISCCPNNLRSVTTSTIGEIYSVGPLYVVFVPVSPLNLELDNICYTATGLPDDSNTFITFISRVFSDGRNEVNSYIISQPRPGVPKYGSSRCSFLDIAFANVIIQGSRNCNMSLIYRCVLEDCPGGDFDVTPPVFGISYIQRPISDECIQQAKDTIRDYGFPDQDYITYPMRLPTKCVFGQFNQCPSKIKAIYQHIGLY